MCQTEDIKCTHSAAKNLFIQKVKMKKYNPTCKCLPSCNSIKYKVDVSQSELVQLFNKHENLFDDTDESQEEIEEKNNGKRSVKNLQEEIADSHAVVDDSEMEKTELRLKRSASQEKQ